MHDPMMAQIMDEHHNNGGLEKFDNNFGSNDGWVDMNGNYSTSQNQSPVYEGQFTFIQPAHHGLPLDNSFVQRSQAPPLNTPHHHQHQQPHLLPLIVPSHATWPSMLTNPAFSSPPVAIPATAPPLVKGSTPKLPAIHPAPRKTLTDTDRRRMCQYHEENPHIKQTEIGAIFGVERSTVSKVLRQKEKYLFPEDRNLSPIKRSKGKFPDIERALSNWVKNSQKQGVPLTDAAIREKARFFATTVGNNESHLKTNSASWLEKFKQKNGIGSKLIRRASETNISDGGSLNPDSAGPSASQTPNGISPTSPGGLPSATSPLSGKSDEEMKANSLNEYFAQGTVYRHSNSQSTTSLSSVFTDTTPSSFSAGPTSPTTPFPFSPEHNSGSWMPSQQSRLPPPGTNFQRPRSQTFPMLGIDPSFLSSQNNEPLTPKYNIPLTAPSSALDSPIHEMPHPFGMDSAISSPPLHHSSSNGSMAPPSSGTPITGLQSPPGSSAPSSPTQDDARRALDTLLNYLQSAPTGMVDQNEYMTMLKLTDRLRLQNNSSNGTLPGGLHRIAEQDCEIAPKMEHSMSAGC